MSDAFEHADGKGSLRRNTFKGDNAKAPDWKGSGKVNGANMDVAMWFAKDKNGETYLSLQFEQPYQKAAPAKPRARQPGDDDEEIPF